jgi:hypothetical protein
MSARRGEAYPVVRQPQSIDSRASEEDAGEPPLVLAGHGRIEAEDIEDRERGLAGGASGSHVLPAGLANATPARDGRVWVLFGAVDVRGWLAVDGGAPPASVLPQVRPLAQRPSRP